MAKAVMSALTRGSESFRMPGSKWAEALALALRFKWNPPGSSTSYLANGFHVSADNAAALSNAIDRIFREAIENPMQFYPTRVDMEQLYLLNEFLRGGAFEVGDE